MSATLTAVATDDPATCGRIICQQAGSSQPALATGLLVLACGCSRKTCRACSEWNQRHRNDWRRWSCAYCHQQLGLATLAGIARIEPLA